MSKRSERREADRLARKAAYQALRQQRAPQTAMPAAEPQKDNTESDLLARAHAFFDQTPVTAPEPELELHKTSEAQVTANRANAQLSTGPRTLSGLAISSRNSLKHGLTAKQTVLPGEDQSAYEDLLAGYTERFQPVGDEEVRLVQSIADATWRTDRAQLMEAALYRKGYLEFEKKFADADPAERHALIMAETYVKYEKSIRNLNMQEARLRRNREKDEKELARIQTLRKRDERIAAEQAAVQSVNTPFPRTPASIQQQNGFVFLPAGMPSQIPLKRSA